MPRRAPSPENSIGVSRVYALLHFFFFEVLFVFLAHFSSAHRMFWSSWSFSSALASLSVPLERPSLLFGLLSDEAGLFLVPWTASFREPLNSFSSVVSPRSVQSQRHATTCRRARPILQSPVAPLLLHRRSDTHVVIVFISPGPCLSFSPTSFTFRLANAHTRVFSVFAVSL